MTRGALDGTTVVTARRLPTGWPAARAALAALLVAALVAAWLWPWRLYGFDPTDEGVQLVQIDRVVAGECPQIDFETSYTPGYFAFHAALLRATGGGLVATRTFGVLLQAATVALGFGLAATWGGFASAVVAALLQVGFLLPFSLRFGAPFDIPYPGWLAMPAALVAQACAAHLALLRAGAGRVARDATARGVPVAVLAGLAAGCAFSIKPNAGLLALAGVALAVTAGWRGRGGVAAALSFLVRLAAAGCTWLLLRGGLDVATACAFALPVGLAVLRPPAVPAHPGDAPRGVRALAAATSPLFVDLAAIAFGFALPVLPWALRMVASLGLFEAIDRVLHLDGSVLRAYTVAIAPPSPATLALVAGGALAAWLSTAGGARARWAPMLLLAGLVAGAAWVVNAQEVPRLAAENAWLWIGPVLLGLGLLLPTGGLRGVREQALLAFASLYQLQEFPRVDLIHVAMSAPPVLLAAAVVGSRLGEGPLAAARRPRALAAAAVALAATLALGRALPTQLARLREPMVALELGPRAPLQVAAARAGDFAWLEKAVREVRARSAPGEPIFAFPDIPGLGFLADRPMPWTYLYFVPGRPSRDDQALIVAELERRPPALAVLHADPQPAFAGADAYFDRIAAFLADHYETVAKTGGCIILGRRRSTVAQATP